VTDGSDPFGVEPLIRGWATTYDLFVRLLPDVALQADGVRSTNDAFRDEIERILDRVIPIYIPSDRLLTVPASSVTESFDWWAVAERLAGIVGEPLRDAPVPVAVTDGPATGAVESIRTLPLRVVAELPTRSTRVTLKRKQLAVVSLVSVRGDAVVVADPAFTQLASPTAGQVPLDAGAF